MECDTKSNGEQISNDVQVVQKDVIEEDTVEEKLVEKLLEREVPGETPSTDVSSTSETEHLVENVTSKIQHLEAELPKTLTSDKVCGCMHTSEEDLEAIIHRRYRSPSPGRLEGICHPEYRVHKSRRSCNRLADLYACNKEVQSFVEDNDEEYLPWGPCLGEDFYLHRRSYERLVEEFGGSLEYQKPEYDSFKPKKKPDKKEKAKIQEETFTESIEIPLPQFSDRSLSVTRADRFLQDSADDCANVADVEDIEYFSDEKRLDYSLEKGAWTVRPVVELEAFESPDSFEFADNFKSWIYKLMNSLKTPKNTQESTHSFDTTSLRNSLENELSGLLDADFSEELEELGFEDDVWDVFSLADNSHFRSLSRSDSTERHDRELQQAKLDSIRSLQEQKQRRRKPQKSEKSGAFLTPYGMSRRESWQNKTKQPLKKDSSTQTERNRSRSTSPSNSESVSRDYPANIFLRRNFPTPSKNSFISTSEYSKAMVQHFSTLEDTPISCGDSPVLKVQRQTALGDFAVSAAMMKHLAQRFWNNFTTGGIIPSVVEESWGSCGESSGTHVFNRAIHWSDSHIRALQVRRKIKITK